MIFAIFLLVLIIIISMTIFYVKQSNVENPSIMDVTKRTTIETTTKESAITITTRSESLKTEILTTETIKITTRRGIVLLNWY